MKELNNSNHTLYTQALRNPTKLSEEELLQLIMRYPFSQPLIFAYERRKVQNGESSPNKSLALLYAPSASWLWTFVHSKTKEAPVSTELQDIPSASHTITSIEALALTEEPIAVIEEIVEGSEEIAVNVATEGSDTDRPEEIQERDELDLLVNQGSVLADFFVFEQKTSEDIAIETPTTTDEKENISLYNDDLLPYSFRWWLHKTRSEYAETYQPFAGPYFPTASNTQFDFAKLDETILDQQIKESIIHFQDPEAKLSEEVKSRPVEFTLPKKTDTIIERFIREEPIIQAPSAENLNNENMARQSAEDNYVFVTETLANIYVDQGLFQKAIEVFHKLILKYPEKKSYFASRIAELEKNL